MLNSPSCRMLSSAHIFKMLPIIFSFLNCLMQNLSQKWNWNLRQVSFVFVLWLNLPQIQNKDLLENKITQSFVSQTVCCFQLYLPVSLLRTACPIEARYSWRLPIIHLASRGEPRSTLCYKRPCFSSAFVPCAGGVNLPNTRISITWIAKVIKAMMCV